MKIICPHCGVKGTLADSFIHKNIRCPRCKEIFRAEAEVEFAPVEEAAPPSAPMPPRPAPSQTAQAAQATVRPPAASPPTTPPVAEARQAPATPPPRPTSQMGGQGGQRPERLVVPPNLELNAQPLGKISQEEAASVEVEELYSEGAAAQTAAQAAPQTPPPTTPPVPPTAKPRDVTEEQVRADLDALFERKLTCAGCGRQADDNEEFSPSRTGFLCSACRAAEESADNFAQPAVAKPTIDWGAAQAASGRRREDELREIVSDSKRRATGPKTSFTVFAVFKEAWGKLKGIKRDVWGAMAIIVLVNLIFGAVVHFLPDVKTAAGAIGLAAVSIVALLLNGLLLSGLSYLGLCQARGEESGWDTMFVSFSPLNLVKLLLLFILLPIIIGLGTVCLIVPGIYLAVTLSFSPLLVLDKGMWPWEAMLESRRESHASCLNIFLLYAVINVAFWAAFLCLLVGLFWMLPLAFVAYGVLYRRLFDGA